MKPRVGVLALQGAVREHLQALERAGADAIPVREAVELETVDGLVIPGGESSTIGMLLERYGMMDPLRSRIAAGLPTFGTCAGLILMAREVEGSHLPRIGCLDVRVRRNAYGRQVDSFETDLEAPELGAGSFRGVFIRAPRITQVGPGVEVLARLPAGPEEAPALVRQDRLLGGAFHPELTEDCRIHDYFLRMVRE